MAFTRNHWEAARLATAVPLARGWERQLDQKTNPLFYDDRRFTTERYQAWLSANAVRWVALPAAPLDYSARSEAALLERGPAFLRLAYASREWRIWEVRDAAPPASGGARMVSAGPEGFEVETAGRTVVRQRYTRYWRAEGGCVRRAPGGWTEVEPRGGALVRVRAASRSARGGRVPAGPRVGAGWLALAALAAAPRRIYALAMAARVLPRGWRDLLRQIVLFCGAYWLYRLVRGLVDGRAAAAFANAREIVHLERSLGLFFEPGLQQWAIRQGWVSDAASWMYVNSHFTITTVTLAWLYLRRNEHFYAVRNMFMIAMGIALVGYMLFPTAPPRFMPELGFQDPVAAFTGVQSSNPLFNPFAAVPSMHVAFALMLGCRWRRWRVAAGPRCCGRRTRRWSPSWWSQRPTTGGSTPSSARPPRPSRRSPPCRGLGLPPHGHATRRAPAA